MNIEEITRDLAAELPTYYPNAAETNNYKALKAVAGQLEKHASDVDSVDIATTVDHAKTIDQLRELGKAVDILPRENEAKEHYRARVKAEYAVLTCEGTISELLEITADILNIRTSALGYVEPSGSEYGTVNLSIPTRAFNNTELSEGEVIDIVDRLIAASYRIDSLTTGTFTYITPTDYNNDNHDSTKGYDGLDSNGDPKNNGGTYAGIL